MPQRVLAVSALLAVLGACGDGPTDPAAPVEARTAVQPEITVSQDDAVRTLALLLDDPFVRELMDGVAADAVSLYGAVRDASIFRRTTDVLTLSRVLTQTRSGLFARAVDDIRQINEWVICNNDISEAVMAKKRG